MRRQHPGRQPVPLLGLRRRLVGLPVQYAGDQQDRQLDGECAEGGGPGRTERRPIGHARRQEQGRARHEVRGQRRDQHPGPVQQKYQQMPSHQPERPVGGLEPLVRGDRGRGAERRREHDRSGGRHEGDGQRPAPQHPTAAGSRDAGKNDEGGHSGPPGGVPVCQQGAQAETELQQHGGTDQDDPHRRVHVVARGMGRAGLRDAVRTVSRGLVRTARATARRALLTHRATPASPSSPHRAAR